MNTELFKQHTDDFSRRAREYDIAASLAGDISGGVILSACLQIAMNRGRLEQEWQAVVPRANEQFAERFHTESKHGAWSDDRFTDFVCERGFTDYLNVMLGHITDPLAKSLRRHLDARFSSEFTHYEISGIVNHAHDAAQFVGLLTVEGTMTEECRSRWLSDELSGEVSGEWVAALDKIQRDLGVEAEQEFYDAPYGSVARKIIEFYDDLDI